MQEQQRLALQVLGNARRERSPEVMNYSVLIYPTETELQAQGYIGANEDDGIYLTVKGWTKYWLLKVGSLRKATRFYWSRMKFKMGVL